MNGCADKSDSTHAGDAIRDARSRPVSDRQRGDLPVIDSTRLFGGATEIGIEHGGAVYRLRITKQGKLILNK